MEALMNNKSITFLTGDHQSASVDTMAQYYGVSKSKMLRAIMFEGLKAFDEKTAKSEFTVENIDLILANEELKRVMIQDPSYEDAQLLLDAIS